MARIQSLQQRIAVAQAPFSAPISIPSPGKGWNSRDELDAMDPQDAVVLDNWFPDAGGCVVRNGFVPVGSSLGSAIVQTLATWDGGAGQKLLAACGGTIYNITDASLITPMAIGIAAIGYGAIGGQGVALPIASGFQNNQWQTCNFLAHLFFVNGTDVAQVFDGTTLSPANFTGTDLDLSTLYGVWLYQQRLFFWQKNSTGFWYASLNSMSGTLTFYDLSAFTALGGHLVAMTTSSYDGGNGVLDYAVFMMSSGEALLFQGNDPSLASNWSLLGTYRISPPVSPRAVTDYGGDSFVTTNDDHVTLQQMFTALRLGEMAPRSKVSKAVQNAVNANPNGQGWQALYYPRGRRLMFNIPNTDGTFDQHVCNTGLPSQPWCRFVGMNGFCWALFNELLYFGGYNGQVYQADTGNMDNLGPVTATAQQAWNKLGNAQRKRVTAARPVVQSTGGVSYVFALGFDYSALNIPIPDVTPGSGSPWDISPWNTSPWSSEVTVDPRWRVGGGTGTAVGWGISIATTQAITWYRTDLRLEGGNAL